MAKNNDPDLARLAQDVSEAPPRLSESEFHYGRGEHRTSLPSYNTDDEITPLRKSPFQPIHPSINYTNPPATGGAANVGKPTDAEILAAKVENARWKLTGGDMAPVDHSKIDYRGWADKGKDALLRRIRK